MLKNIIAPVQAWLLFQGRCVGCGASLKKAKAVKKVKQEEVTCQKCGRIYIFDHETQRFRRASLSTVK